MRDKNKWREEMKRVVLVCLAVVFACVFAACQGPAQVNPTVNPSTEAAPTEGAPAGESASVDTTPIKLGHLQYYTGMFSHAGLQFDIATNFAMSFINEDPPLGRPIELINQDLGTIGEGEAAKILLENKDVDILLNVAGEYQSYRDWLLAYIRDNGKPILPSVHAGSQPSRFGGTVEEPIFRGAPQDADQGIAAVEFLYEQGVKKVAVLAVENDGMQLMQAAAIGACKELGIEVVGEFDFEAEQPTYRNLAAKVQALNPDAVLNFAAATDGGTLVKNAAELGMSAIFVAGTDWLDPAFGTAVGDGALQAHKGVYCTGFTNSKGPAWDFYSEQWELKKDITGDMYEASNSYNLEFYDLLNVTMLAIEKAGSVEIDDWVSAVRAITTPGEGKTKVYTYQQGIDALRNGEEIDYEGVTGSFEYSPTGVVSGNFGVFQWKSSTNRELLTEIDGKKVLELSTKVGLS